MRTSIVVILLFAAMSAMSAIAADADRPRLELNRAGQQDPTPEKQANIIAWCEKLLISANFNTANQPEILKQNVATIQERFRKAIRGDYVVVSYDQPTKFKTVAGDVTVVEIIVGLNKSSAIAGGLFTVDPEGRVIAHEKYAGVLPSELSP